MVLKYYGHACFKLESAAGSVVFDPYVSGYVPGFSLPPLDADLVISSHEHSDHYAPDSVKLSGKEHKFTVEQIETFHDEEGGALRGKNIVSVVNAEGLRIAHLGDLGHELSDTQLEKLGKPDVLMIPVGGFYTIDAVAAKNIVDACSPRLVVPMHYREGERGLQVIAEVESFLKLFPESEVRRLSESRLELTDEALKGVCLFALP